jgi:hypothetical protein
MLSSFILGIIEASVEMCDNPSLKARVDSVRNFKERNEISFLSDIPSEFEKNSITLNGEEIKTGSILMRPIRQIELLNLEYHYAIVLGTDKSSNKLFLEMTTSPYHIRVATMKDFLTSDYTERDIIIFFKANVISQDLIIEKAKEIRFEGYSFLDLNCKQFVEYIIFGVEPTKYSKEIKEVLDRIISITREARFPNQ